MNTKSSVVIHFAALIIALVLIGSGCGKKEGNAGQSKLSISGGPD